MPYAKSADFHHTKFDGIITFLYFKKIYKVRIVGTKHSQMLGFLVFTVLWIWGAMVFKYESDHLFG